MTQMDEGLQIALQTLLNQQSQIAADVSALRADTSKAITHLEVIDTRNKGADEKHNDFETRIRILEKFRYTLAGMAVIGGVLAGFLGYLLSHLVKLCRVPRVYRT